MPRRRWPPIGPDPRVALAQYRRRAAVYDLELAPLEPIRRRAVDALGLRPGDTVLDLGCGTGLSLPLLQAAVGSRGHVVGVELSPQMLGRARERVERHSWRNVRLHNTPVAQAPLDSRADAALLHFTHDILQDDAALRHVAAHVRPGGRIVASGLKWAPPRTGLLNLLVMPAALHSVSSLDGLDQPWRRLAALIGEPELRSLLGGTVYVACWRRPDHVADR